MADVVAVHVWFDEPTAADRGVDAYYSISEMDADDNEIACVGGSRDLDTAWARGCERAAYYGVECVQQAYTTGEVTDRRPAPGAESEHDDDALMAMATAHLGAERRGDYWRYYDDATARWYLATDADIIDLGARLAAGERDAYSLWCAATEPRLDRDMG